MRDIQTRSLSKNSRRVWGNLDIEMAQAFFPTSHTLRGGLRHESNDLASSGHEGREAFDEPVHRGYSNQVGGQPAGAREGATDHECHDARHH